MKSKLSIPVSILLAVLLLSPALTLGMSETFCSYKHHQLIQFNLTLLIKGNQTSWHIQTSPGKSVSRPAAVIVKPAPAPERFPSPASFPRLMFKQVRQGTRVLGLAARISARLMKHWLLSQADNFKSLGNH